MHGTHIFFLTIVQRIFPPIRLHHRVPIEAIS